MIIIKFWKPYGVLTKFTDREGRPTLADYVSLSNIYSAGRLDMDSEGLLLLTDSGRLSTQLTDPRFAHPRTYLVQVERIPDDAALRRLRDGLVLNDGPTRPAQVERLAEPPLLPNARCPSASAGAYLTAGCA